MYRSSTRIARALFAVAEHHGKSDVHHFLVPSPVPLRGSFQGETFNSIGEGRWKSLEATVGWNGSFGRRKCVRRRRRRGQCNTQFGIDDCFCWIPLSFVISIASGNMDVHYVLDASILQGRMNRRSKVTEGVEHPRRRADFEFQFRIFLPRSRCPL
jgi:hypothetical protein